LNVKIKVETFYQDNIGLWVIIATNEAREQIGKLTYATDEKEANMEVERVRKILLKEVK